MQLFFKIQYIVILFLVWSLWGQIPSNLDLLQGMVSQPVLNAVDSLATAPVRIMIESKSSSEFSDWLVQQLRKELLSKNYWLGADVDTSQVALTIVIEDLKSEIVYRGIDRDLWLRVSKYQRSIETLLTFYIKNNRESILYTYSKRNEQKNVLSKSQIDQVENNFFSFSEGQKIESGIVNKLIEPAIITIATAGVIYLFFSLRSGS
ncbi:MAG: hypothetical protein A2Y94_10310 [Caldithrix sp. RBG_13_44_9]|nr:MAG: hypothetical protein A2Y94_10310 [Caldithrix sp. RBG_13_44_9]